MTTTQVQCVEDGSLSRVATATFGRALHVAVFLTTRSFACGSLELLSTGSGRILRCSLGFTAVESSWIRRAPMSCMIPMQTRECSHMPVLTILGWNDRLELVLMFNCVCAVLAEA